LALLLSLTEWKCQNRETRGLWKMAWRKVGEQEEWWWWEDLRLCKK